MASTSDPPRRAFVWAWLPGRTEPVFVGAVEAPPADAPRRGQSALPHRFAYSPSYLERPEAVSLFTGELPLRPGWQVPLDGMVMAGCLRDASPDSWGQRVIIDRLLGLRGAGTQHIDLDDLVYLLESGSNRIGALDFQLSSTEYVPRETGATLDELHRAAQAMEDGTLTPELAAALADGTAVGGARPKVLVAGDNGVHYIAKLSLSTDTFPIVKAEAAGMELARRVGVPVPETRLVHSLGRDVLLVERFDRPGDGTRRQLLSALTLLGFSDFLGARWSSYPEFLDSLHRYASAGTGSLGRALLDRVINILIGNTDDHARNHAAFWDGRNLQLAPAYDVSPQARSGTQARQAMDIGRAPSPDKQGPRWSNRSTVVAAARDYGLAPAEVEEMFDRQVHIIEDAWPEVVEVAELTTNQAAALKGRQIGNAFALE